MQSRCNRVLSSALCMDKDRAHALARTAGVAVPRSFVLRRKADAQEASALAEKLGWPLFVKPVRAGSSFGITRVTEPEQLPDAVRLAFRYDSEVILEEAISGFEVGCAVMGNDSLTVGAVDEIELSGGFFDFTEKYTLKTSAIHVPTRISPQAAQAVKDTAKKIYRVFGCRGFARVDMFLYGHGADDPDPEPAESENNGCVYPSVRGRNDLAARPCRYRKTGRTLPLRRFRAAAPGDTAVLIGKSGSLEISACSLAERTGTIPNEILSRLGSRMERILI